MKGGQKGKRKILQQYIPLYYVANVSMQNTCSVRHHVCYANAIRDFLATDFFNFRFLFEQL